MSSYLNIYLQKKKKEEEENVERLLLCSISRANDIYSLFYDNKPGSCRENDMHEFTSEDLDTISSEIDREIANEIIRINNLKNDIHLVSDKDVINEMLDNLDTARDWLETIKRHREALDTMYMIFNDVGKEWSAFDKLYWSID